MNSRPRKKPNPLPPRWKSTIWPLLRTMKTMMMTLPFYLRIQPKTRWKLTTAIMQMVKLPSLPRKRIRHQQPISKRNWGHSGRMERMSTTQMTNNNLSSYRLQLRPWVPLMNHLHRRIFPRGYPGSTSDIHTIAEWSWRDRTASRSPNCSNAQAEKATSEDKDVFYHPKLSIRPRAQADRAWWDGFHATYTTRSFPTDNLESYITYTEH